jgi:hypothetical protein
MPASADIVEPKKTRFGVFCEITADLRGLEVLHNFHMAARGGGGKKSVSPIVLLSIYRSTSQGPQREIPRSYRKAGWELQVQTLNRHKRLPPARLAYTGVVATWKTISNSGLLTQTSWLATVITCFHVAVTPQLSPATRDLHLAAI